MLVTSCAAESVHHSQAVRPRSTPLKYVVVVGVAPQASLAAVEAVDACGGFFGGVLFVVAGLCWCGVWGLSLQHVRSVTLAV